MEKKNIILEKTFWFGVGIVEFSDELVARKRFVLADQVLRAGTSVGANVREAQNASTKKEFIRILKIALREADESEFWLQICKHAKGHTTNEKLLSEAGEIKKILSKIIITTRQKMKPKQNTKINSPIS